MMSFSSPSSICITILMFISLMAAMPLLHAADAQTQKLIDTICRQMEQYQFCNHTFNNNLNSPSASPVDLTKVTIDQSLANATGTLDFIHLLQLGNKDPDMGNKLSVCENVYSIVSAVFHEAKGDFDEQRFREMVEVERKSVRPQSSCITMFQSPPDLGNPLEVRNTQMRILITMAVVTGSLMGN
ncbi:hypothetical protein Droror1_Dr00019524 [Drosera rotundifolia]